MIASEVDACFLGRDVAMFFYRDFFFAYVTRPSETDLKQSTQNLNGNGLQPAHGVATTGEVFEDGSMIELIRLQDSQVGLMFFSGEKETAGAVVEHHGRRYEPAMMSSGLARMVVLPTRCCSHGTTRDLLTHTCNLISSLVGIDGKLAQLVARVVLCSALVEDVAVAPTLLIVGPDRERAKRLVDLLTRLCRHSLRLTGVTSAGICSLAGGPRFTWIISQSALGEKLEKLLVDASVRDHKIPCRGRLLDLFGVQIIHSDATVACRTAHSRFIEIPMIPGGPVLPQVDSEMWGRIATDFQARLLSFRRTNLGAAQSLKFDASKFTPELRDLARSLAAATPDDVELQAEVFDLLREEDQQIRGDRWTRASNVALEAVLVAGSDSSKSAIYVADLADIAQEILRRRGEPTAQIDPAVFGKQIKELGFATSRDAKGKKLILTVAVMSHAGQLLQNLGGPGVEDSPKTLEAVR
jgi:hypothetical protein